MKNHFFNLYALCFPFFLFFVPGGLADGGRIGFGDSSNGGFNGGATPNVPCPLGMFRCNDGKCITSLWVCNYQKDCEGGEDEQQSCRKYSWRLPLIHVL